MLKSLDHPGVVRFIGTVDTPDGGRAMHTEFVSSDTWATRPLTDPAERAAGVAALAAVVADLHDLGIAHCQLSTAHVLHGEGDRPVLCGLRLAAEASRSNRHADLVALADLCHGPSLEGGPLTPKLSSLADATRAGRLSARELARRLDLLVPKRSTVAEPIRTAGGGSGGRHKIRSRRRSLMAAGALLAASAAALALGIWSRGDQAVSTPVTIIDGTEPTDGSSSQAGSIAAPEAAEASDPPVAVTAAARDTQPQTRVRRRRRHNRRRGTRFAGLGDSRRRGFSSRRERSRGRGARRIPRADVPESSTAAPEPDRTGSGETPASTPFRSQAARRRPRLRTPPTRGRPEDPPPATRQGRVLRARRVPLRRRRARRLRADGRLGLRRPGHPGDHSSQHRSRRAVRCLAGTGPEHLDARALAGGGPDGRRGGLPRLL